MHFFAQCKNYENTGKSRFILKAQYGLACNNFMLILAVLLYFVFFLTFTHCFIFSFVLPYASSDWYYFTIGFGSNERQTSKQRHNLLFDNILSQLIYKVRMLFEWMRQLSEDD